MQQNTKESARADSVAIAQATPFGRKPKRARSSTPSSTGQFALQIETGQKAAFKPSEDALDALAGITRWYGKVTDPKQRGWLATQVIHLLGGLTQKESKRVPKTSKAKAPKPVVPAEKPEKADWKKQWESSHEYRAWKAAGVARNAGPPSAEFLALQQSALAKRDLLRGTDFAPVPPPPPNPRKQKKREERRKRQEDLAMSKIAGGGAVSSSAASHPDSEMEEGEVTASK